MAQRDLIKSGDPSIEFANYIQQLNERVRLLEQQILAMQKIVSQFETNTAT